MRVLCVFVATVVVTTGVLVTSVSAAPKPGTRSRPYPVGKTVTVARGEWKLRVNRSVPNATSIMLAENSFNRKPLPGYQYYMFNLTVTYAGADSGSVPEFLTDIGLVGASNVAYTIGVSTSCGGPAPKDFLLQPDTLLSGGKETGNDCRSVFKRDARSMTLYWGSGTERVFFKLHR